jgi:predicted dehydrogenase
MRNRASRRQFLKRAAATAGAVGAPYFIPAFALGRDGATAPSNKIIIGCIGTGGRGTANMKAFLREDDARVVAVCDVYENRRQNAKALVDKQYGDKACMAYGDFRELLARKDIDAVMIATQDHWHAPIVVAAAHAGKDMYCEKPLGVSIKECQAIRDAVGKAGRVFQTGTQQRSERNFRFACELARNGYVGKIHTVQVAAEGPKYKPSYKGPLDPQPVPSGFDYDTWLGPAPQKPYNPGRMAWPDWYLIWDYCAGFIVNWGVHHLDIANWGCPTVGSESFEVECKASYRNEGFTDNVDAWKANLAYANGLKMVFSDDLQQKIGCRFIGDTGWVHVDRAGIWADPESLLKATIKPNEIHLHESDNHYADFLKSVRTRRDPVSDLDSGYKASILGMIADISARLKRKLKWDAKAEQFVGDREANGMSVRPLRNPWHL